MLTIKTLFRKTIFMFMLLSLCIVLTTDAATLKFINHAFVKLVSNDGTVIYIDPYAEDEKDDEADIILITHEHGDHTQLNRVTQKATCQVIRNRDAQLSGVYQEFTMGSVHVKAVPAYNSDKDYHKKNACVGYVITFDNIKVYHAGDTGKIDEFADLASENIDYALLPIDGIYTMTPAEATEAAAMIQAKHDIPIHTMPPPDTYNTANVANFTSPNKLEVLHGTTITLEAASTAVGNNPAVIKTYSLNQNYPNPFNPETFITFNVSRIGDIAELSVYDILGSHVNTLFKSVTTQNKIRVAWNGTNHTGDIMPSGIYFARLKTGNHVESIKMTLME